ncbi:MAG: large conductance mechanosensitive channel protein MscL [Dehalococcoidia bacterium]
MFQEFRQFLLRGNVVDLAVAVVIGAAFGAVVDSFVSNLLTPVISMIFGEPSLASMTFRINDSIFAYGAFLDSVFSFAAIAAAVFFFVVKPVNTLISRSRREPTPDPTTKRCPECLSEVPIDARRCAHCTVVFAAA